MSGSSPSSYPPPASPSQTRPYHPPYSPTHQTRSYYPSHEYQSIPPAQRLAQTPPFPPVSLVHSPHHGRPPPVSPGLPPPNAGPTPLQTAPGYQQQVTSSSPYPPLQRSYSGHYPNHPMSQFDGPAPTHAHPSSRAGSVLQSPSRDPQPMQNGASSDYRQSDSRPQSKDVSPF
jgi:hypothetical protein